MICDMIYQDMTWLNIIPLLFNCLIFFTCSDDCTEKIVYWWREIRNEIHKVVVYVNEEIDTDVITFHYSSMLKGRQREWERESNPRKKLVSFKKTLCPLSKISHHASYYHSFGK